MISPKKKPSAKTRHRMYPLLRVGASLCFMYLVVVLFMAGCQRQMIYYPARAPEATLQNHAAQTGFVPWHDQAGAIIGWKSPEPRDGVETARIVVFHGNAGFALNRVFYFDGFRRARDDSWRVYLFEYPGYGARPGKPSEDSFQQAAAEAVGELAAASDAPLYIVGESLGSGVATRLAARFPQAVDGLILITPFTSLADVGSRHFPWLPVRTVLLDRYNNVEALADYNGPVAILVAEHDRVVPADLGKGLYESYHGPKRLWIQHGKDHNDLDLTSVSPFWVEVTGFLDENTSIP